MDAILNFLTNELPLLGNWGYALAFALALAETTIGVGMFIPGSTALIFLGVYAGLTGSLDFFDLIFFAALGATLGDNVNYYIGSRFGGKWLKTGFGPIKAEHFQAGHHFFEKYGGKSVLLGRFVPMVKEVVPFIAGSLRMNHLEFFIFNVLGAIGWAFEFIGVGFLVAGSLALAKVWLGRLSFIIFAIIFLVVLLSVIDWLVQKYGEKIWHTIKDLFSSLKEYCLRKPIIKKWVHKHPGTARFLAERINLNKFTGLPLTILTTLFVYVFLVFAGLVEDFVTGDTIVSVDQRLNEILYLFRDLYLVTVFLWISLLGKSETIIIGLVASVIILLVIKKQKEIIPLLLSVIGATSFTFLTKLFFARPRPELAAYVEHSFSFPSGHATVAVAFYGFIGWLIVKQCKSWRSKVNTVFLALFVIGAIAFSRLYLGVHYLSDVLGGLAIGTMSLLLAITISEYLDHKKDELPNFFFKEVIKTNKKTIIVATLLITLGVFVAYGKHYQNNMEFNYQSSPATTKNQIVKVADLIKDERYLYTQTLTGRLTEPINFIFLTTNHSNLENLLAKHGWQKSDELGMESSIKMFEAWLGKQSYERKPVVPLFLDGEIPTADFAKNINGEKHWLRIWQVADQKDNGELIWLALITKSENFLAADELTVDLGTERELLWSDLKNDAGVELKEIISPYKPSTGVNYADQKFSDDGRVYVVEVNY